MDAMKVKVLGNAGRISGSDITDFAIYKDVALAKTTVSRRKSIRALPAAVILFLQKIVSAVVSITGKKSATAPTAGASKISIIERF